MTRGTLPHVAASIAAVVLTTALGCPVGAQTIPEGQSCGGLVCDLGIIGHKMEPASAAPPTAAAAVPQTTAEVAPKPHAPRVRKRVASKPAATKPVGTKPVEQPKAVVARPAPVTAPPPPVVASRPRPTPTPSLSPPSPPAVAVQMPEPAPVRQRPLIFQSIDPTLQ